MMKVLVSASLLVFIPSTLHGFVLRTPSSTPTSRCRFPRLRSFQLASTFSGEDEAKALLERAKKMREEIAELEGRTVEDVEREAQEKARQKKELKEQAEAERQKSKKTTRQISRTDGRFLTVPETHDEQVEQAAAAVQRALKDGHSRQVVRFALVPEDETLNQEDRQWPGGAQQMYRRAAGPLTRNLLRTLGQQDDFRRPNVTSQDVWEFDGSALVTVEAASGPQDDIQALVFANTDNKYTEDIATIDAAMKERLFILVNPFWRNLDSWGFNLLAPKAKELAQAAIFDRGFEETYVLLQRSVRGEDCIALKAYPYDWQLYAYVENDYWPYDERIVHLGSTKEEPTTSDFVSFLSERDEFKMNKNMRQMQRMVKKNDE